MLGIFNRKNSWKLGLQAVNLAALTLATYDLYQNPEKLAQRGLDITVHAINFLCLRENVGALESLLASSLNNLQVGALYTGATSGCPSLSDPLPQVAVDVAAHTLSGLTLLFGSDDTEDHRQPTVPNPN